MQELDIAYFGRPADTSGLQNLAAALSAISASTNAGGLVAAYSGNATVKTLVDAFGTSADFTTQIGLSSSAIIQYSGAAAADIARTMLTNVSATTDPAKFDVQTPIDYIIGGIPVNTYNLTTSVEAIVGGPGENVFNSVLDNAAGEAAGGQLPTLLAGDSITGGTMNNTLNIIDFGIGAALAIPDGVKLNGITRLSIASLEAVSGDFSGWQGLTTLDVRASAGSDVIVVSEDAMVSVNDSDGSVTVQGGADVTIAAGIAHAALVISTAGKFSATLGDSTNTVTDMTAGAAVSISAGSGANTVTLGAGASGTVTFNAHAAGDAVILGPNGATRLLPSSPLAA